MEHPTGVEPVITPWQGAVWPPTLWVQLRRNRESNPSLRFCRSPSSRLTIPPSEEEGRVELPELLAQRCSGPSRKTDIRVSSKVRGAGIEPASSACRTEAQPLDQPRVRAPRIELGFFCVSCRRLTICPCARGTGGGNRTLTDSLMKTAFSLRSPALRPRRDSNPHP